MTAQLHALLEGDRVSALRRAHFPNGTVMKVMELGYVLVRWDGDVLETAHHSDLTKVDSGAAGA